MEKPLLAAFLSVSGTSLNDEEKRLINKYNPLGISLFNRNIQNKQQLKQLLSEIKETAENNNIILAVDQEGGRVRRLGEPEFRPYAGQQTLGRLAEEISENAAETAVSLQAALISHDLSELGINMNYAPVLDVRYPDTSPVLASRIFSSDAKLTAKLGSIMAKEYIRRGIIPCIKHMPGHGRAQTDPHLNLPVISASFDELKNDFLPFQKLANAPAGMTAHIILSCIDSQNPATQSPRVISEIIRQYIGFRGFLISDAVDMHALKGSIGEKTKASVAAGCDAVCYCGGKIEELHEVCANAGYLADKSFERFAEMQKTLYNSVEDNVSELGRRYEEITGQIEPYLETYDATEVLFKMQQP